MTDFNQQLFSNGQEDYTKEVLDIRSSFPPRAPLHAQLEAVWLEGDDITAAELSVGIQRIQEITGRHDII